MRYLLHHGLQESASRWPDRPAVVDGDRSCTYRELDESSNRIARHLVEGGLRNGERVGLYLDKSIEAIVGAYGILKAGAAYVPLDPDAPPLRLNHIIRDCGARFVLTSVAKYEHTLDVVEGSSVARVIVLDGDAGTVTSPAVHVEGSEALSSQSDDPPTVPTIDRDLAYILYTSGSTGRPKGVMLSHRAAMAFVGWAIQEFDLGPEDRLSSHAPLHFDLSVFDLYAASATGSAVVLVPPRLSMFPPRLKKFIEDAQITVWYSVPSALSMLAVRGGLEVGDLSRLRRVLFAGEVFPTQYLTRLMGLLPHSRFANLYGPTETNVCTWHDLGSTPPDGDVPIGRGIPNDHVYAVTSEGRMATSGERGELYVRGATVMDGYWNDAERTAEALVSDPLRTDAVDLSYRTGDIVEVLDDGGFHYVGRRDFQIKTRGYRVELGEIETALHSHSSVVECAVIAVPDELVTNRLIAFATVRDEMDAEGLITFCRQQLPRYMVPDEMHLRPSLPRTSTGKIDRRGLESHTAG